MKTLLKMYVWLKEYWYIPLFVLGSILLWVFSRKSSTPLALTLAELDVIKAGSEAEKLKAVFGNKKAKTVVEEKYKESYRNLTDDQKKEADALQKDPKKLARFLVRAGQSR